MLNVGLTGNIGSGKSTVAQLLRARGAAVIDADVLAREATEDAQVLERIAKQFGPAVVRDGQLDRSALAAIVFGAEAKRLQLNGIIHPWVRHKAAKLLEDYREEGFRVVVQDIPLLFEGSLQDSFDKVLVVTAPFELRMERARLRSGLDPAEFRKRDSAQWPLERKAELADYVLDNSGTEVQLEEQVEQIWRELNT